MQNQNDKPLVSFIIISFKQEKFIRESIRSALKQTYEQLEIIISDDCSPDNTFSIIEDELNNYRGFHKILLNRNPTNIGLVRNLEKAVSLATGDLLVIQAGDDISLPERTEKLVFAWQKPYLVDLVCSDVFLMDESGKTTKTGWFDPPVFPLTLEEALNSGKCYALGCAAAYTPKLFRAYPAIHQHVFQEDNILTFRALLGNGVRSIPDQLVGYRQHSQNIYAGKSKSMDNRFHESITNNRWGIYQDMLKSYDMSSRANSEQRAKLLKNEILWRHRALSMNESFIQLMPILKHGLKCGLSIRNILGIIRLNITIKRNNFFSFLKRAV